MKTDTRQPHPSRGFSLMELLVALAVVGILAGVAYPSYQNHVRKANRSDAQTMLLEILSRQQNFISRNMTYTANLIQLGYANDPVVTNNGLYSIAAATCNPNNNNNFSNDIADCVALTATAQGRQLADGNLTINSAGVKTPAGKW